LTEGDLVLVPHGGSHTIGDAATSPIIDSFSFSENASLKLGVLRRGGNGVVTSIVCGSMQFENPETDPLLAILPSVIHVKPEGGRDCKWLPTTIAQLLDELDPCRAETEAIVARLADIVFVQAIASYFDQNIETATSGCLAAIRDPQIGQALVLLHTHPGESWTVTSLARRVAVSRSLFAAKFAQLVGEPPLRYLKRLRLTAAALRLRSTDNKLDAVANDAGYESAASFTKAFKSYLGIPPGEYRRTWFEKTCRPVSHWQSGSTEHETAYKHCG
jgi:AraC-like DNA-binding protein